MQQWMHSAENNHQTKNSKARNAEKYGFSVKKKKTNYFGLQIELKTFLKVALAWATPVHLNLPSYV